MEYPIEKQLECIGEYNEGSHSYEVYDIPIYAIPLNKKGFCRAFSHVDTKDGGKKVPLCVNFHNHKSCNRCVTNAKIVYKLNHENKS